MKLIFILTISVLTINFKSNGDSLHKNEIFSIKPPEFRDSDEGFVLFFYSPNGSKIVPNLNVLIQTFDGTMEDMIEKSRDQIKSLNLKTIKMSIETNQAFIEYNGNMETNKMHFYQKCVKNGNKFYIITATSLETDWDSKKSELVNSVNSFKLNHLDSTKNISALDKKPNEKEVSSDVEPTKIKPIQPYISNTKEQIKWMIANGIDTNTHDIYSDGRVVEKPEIAKARSDRQSEIFRKAKWIVSVEDGPYRGTWGSEKEPKSFGNGIRFTVVGTETEIIVNGQFSIRKIE